MRLRSIVRVPAGGDVEAALASPADAVALTLADARHDVEALRRAATEALPRIREAGKRGLLFVNHPRTQLLRGDLEATVSEALDGVILVHSVEPQDVRDLAVLLRELEYGRGMEPGTVAAFPVIDTARGLLRAPQLAEAAPRVGGLLFDTARYAADVGARSEERGERLAYARGAVVAAARAHEGQPLVIGGELELTNLAQYGFAGAVIDDARAAATANSVFAPTDERAARARAEAEAYDAARTAGAWVARVDGYVVDAHTARKARRLAGE